MKISSIALFAVLFVSSAVSAEEFSGKVVGVVDGDTISVMRDGKAVRVRLHGIDCPEKRQAYGSRAKQFASDLVFGKHVAVEVTDVDRYRRLIGKVRLADGRILNHELVRSGLAWWYRKYAAKDTVLKSLENQARIGKVGLWAEKSPVPPWAYRRKGK
jgi:micrococcal nuclease